METMQVENVGRWTRAEAKAMKVRPFSREVLRALVDFRFSAQGKRKGSDNQVRAIKQRVDVAPDLEILDKLGGDFRLIEGKADRAIEAMVMAHRAGRWAVSVPGIGATFAGVLLAYVDIRPWHCAGTTRTQCTADEPCTPDCGPLYINTAGKLWRFAGVDPTSTWEKKQKRPYCALLKTLVWQIGESFKKLGAESACLYAKMYRQRKAQEVERNEAGMFRDQALLRLEKATKNKWGISPEQRAIWGSGKLQPIGLDMRAGRYAAKMFLSHFHHVLHEVEEGCAPPVPYILGPGGHADYIAPPNWPIE
jgi:hypothetical protein